MLAATAPTLGRTLDIDVMTTDIPAQQPGTAALLTGDRCLQPTNNSTQQSGVVDRYSFQIVAVDVVVCIDVIHSVMRRSAKCG